MSICRFAAAVGIALLSVVALDQGHAQTGVDLLENGGFEYATTGLNDGNNINSVPTGWTLSAGAANWQQGTAQGTGAVPPLAPYNGPYSGGTTTTAYNSDADIVGGHFFDGTNDNAAGDTILSQSFTLTKTTTLIGSFALGIRDQGGNQAGTGANAANTSRIDILDGSNTSLLTVYGDTQATTDGWEVNSFTLAGLAAGTYTFQVTLEAKQNIDAIALVPEPSAWAAVTCACSGLALWRRARRPVLTE